VGTEAGTAHICPTASEEHLCAPYPHPAESHARSIAEYLQADCSGPAAKFNESSSGSNTKFQQRGTVPHEGNGGHRNRQVPAIPPTQQQAFCLPCQRACGIH
jgi:hypothetical protein